MIEKINQYNYGKFALPLMVNLAKKYGIPYTLNNTFGGKCAILEFPNGNFLVWDSPFNINYAGSIKACLNKDICNYLLSKKGFKVPKSENFTREKARKSDNITLKEPILDFVKNATKMGFKFPLIIKPGTLSQGTGIVKINNYEDASTSIDSVLSCDSKTFIVQEFCIGSDYRVVVLNNKIIQAYERVPFHIVGDGTTPINSLIKNKVEYFLKADRDKEVSMDDYRIWKCVKDANHTPYDILNNNEILNLQNIANLSLGGESKDVLETMSPYIKDVSKDIANTLNLKMCGIDYIIKDINDNESSKNYSVLEVNSAPGIDNYLYNDEKKQEEYVNSLYENIFLYLLETNSKNSVSSYADSSICEL